jgi:RNA polymerase sigma factor (sigma-70 family)
MSSAGSVTCWIEALRTGEREAAQKLWERYFPRLVGLAHKKLQGVPRRAADEEDVALSAFHSFCRGVEQGRFPQLADKDNLWNVLVVITARKASDLRAHLGRKKRGGGRVGGESVLDALLGGPEGEAGLGAVVGPEPTPEFAAQMTEEYQRLLAMLPKVEWRIIAQRKMEGYTNAEIAARLGCAEVTIERRLRDIRTCWQQELAP